MWRAALLRWRAMRELRSVKFFPIFLVASVFAIETAIESILDETVIGNLFDDVAFGAINLTEPYLTLCEFVSYLICVGGTALIVRAHGEGDKEKMSNIFGHCITCCVVVGVLFFAVYMIFSGALVNLVAGGTEELEFSRQVFLGECFYVMGYPLCAFLQTYVLYRGGYVLCGVATGCCIVLNPLLSYALAKAVGIGGVTIATAIINAIEILLMILYITRKKHRLSFRVHLDGSIAKKIFYLGLGESSIFLAVTIMEASVNAIAVRNYQTQGVVVAAIIINLLEIVMYVSEGISEYETVALNEYIGRRDTEGIKRTIRTIICAAVVEGVVFSIIFVFAAPFFPSMFDIDDPVTAAIAVNAIRIVALVPVVICTVRIVAIFYQYTQRIGRTVTLFLSAWGVMPAICAYIFGSFSPEGIVAGIILGIAFAISILCGYIKMVKREPIWYFSLDSAKPARESRLRGEENE